MRACVRASVVYFVCTGEKLCLRKTETGDKRSLNIYENFGKLCARACVRACGVRAWVRAFDRACVCVWVCGCECAYIRVSVRQCTCV